ncbi:MAG TPA: hypothetical protein VMU15_10635 [Anaeromyxobacter sp.]|nr:hypothetical protein [Anaeromyxobacter sp.]
MALRRLAVCSILGAALLWAHPARAGSEASVGADFLVDDNAGGFLGTLALDTGLARHVTAGVRFGLFMESGPTRLGFPADLRIRFRVHRNVYIDGLAGPWVVFGGDQHLRFHAGVGAGIILLRKVTFGAELGYLDPSSMIGVRLGFAL